MTNRATRQHLRSGLISLPALLLLAGSLAGAAAPGKQNSGGPLAATLHYISNTWSVLTRSDNQCKTLHAPKAPGRSMLYFPADFPVPETIRQLVRSCPVQVRHLPVVIHHLGQVDVSKIQPPGLLYLPHAYVVPGGMFNEMYGWDSYFILRGLLRAGKLDLARGMVENFFFELRHYGAILNSNRTYHLTRSQPPFLSEMVRAVYDAEESRGRRDGAWLKEAYPFVVQNERFWTQPANLAGTTGLSRYFDFGQGPAPELGASADAYYRNVASYFLEHPAAAQGYLMWAASPSLPHLGALYPVYVCNPRSNVTVAGSAPGAACQQAGQVSLSSAFYKGDRSLRASGFDITFKFGPFGDATPDYAPVGLNCLLYREEKDLEWMSSQMGRAAQAGEWRAVAAGRRAEINRYFWNAKRGLYFDYDFKTRRQSTYIYATTFYPLWVGAASIPQAQAVIQNVKLFDEPGGMVMSRQATGGQWDYPYGWAPVELIAVEGLRRYGDDADANRISADFLSMIVQNFSRDRTLLEKYNVVTRSSETNVRIGYRKNQVGFGWTNGVFVTLLHELPASWRSYLEGSSPGPPKGTTPPLSPSLTPRPPGFSARGSLESAPDVEESKETSRVGRCPPIHTLHK